jgi:hypothetical protein
LNYLLLCRPEYFVWNVLALQDSLGELAGEQPTKRGAPPRRCATLQQANLDLAAILQCWKYVGSLFMAAKGR